MRIIPLILPLFLMACGSGSTNCGTSVQLGDDASPFVPYCDGDAVLITGSEGSYAIALGFELRDMDASAGATAVLRATFEGREGSFDALGGVVVTEADGLYSGNTALPLPDVTAAEMAAFDGQAVQLSGAFTAAEQTQEVILQLVASAP